MANDISKKMNDEELDQVNGGFDQDIAKKIQSTVKIAGAVGTAAAKSVLGNEKVEAVKSLIGK